MIVLSRHTFSSKIERVKMCAFYDFNFVQISARFLRCLSDWVVYYIRGK
jgi:hypothetical protein